MKPEFRGENQKGCASRISRYLLLPVFIARTPELSTRFNVKAINRFLLAEKGPDAVGF